MMRRRSHLERCPGHGRSWDRLTAITRFDHYKWGQGISEQPMACLFTSLASYSVRLMPLGALPMKDRSFIIASQQSRDDTSSALSTNIRHKHLLARDLRGDERRTRAGVPRSTL